MVFWRMGAVRARGPCALGAHWVCVWAWWDVRKVYVAARSRRSDRDRSRFSRSLLRGSGKCGTMITATVPMHQCDRQMALCV